MPQQWEDKWYSTGTGSLSNSWVTIVKVFSEGQCTYYVITFGSPEQFVISCLNLDLSVQKCDYLQDQEDNLRNLAHILACCVASEMTSGVRATLLFVGHQLRPIGLPVACTVVFCTVVFCTVVFCTASSDCSTSANMPLGCKARHFTSMGKSIRSGNFKLPVVAIIVLPLPLHCTNGGAKAKRCICIYIYVQLTLEKKTVCSWYQTTIS